MPVCLSVCLSVCSSACQSVCLSVRQSIYPSIYLSVCSVCMSALLTLLLSPSLSPCLTLLGIPCLIYLLFIYLPCLFFSLSPHSMYVHILHTSLLTSCTSLLSSQFDFDPKRSRSNYRTACCVHKNNIYLMLYIFYVMSLRPLCDHHKI